MTLRRCLPLLALLTLHAQTPVIKSTSRLVQVNVVVHKGGKPVRGLTRDDFRIFDNGKLQNVQYFSAQERDPQVTNAASPAPEPLPHGIASNRLIVDGVGVSAAAADSRVRYSGALTAVLIDTSRLDWTDQIQAKKGIVKLLQGLQPEDRVAVYVLAGRLRVLHGFSSDAASLVHAVDHLRIEYGNGMSDAGKAITVTQAPGPLTSDESELNSILRDVNKDNSNSTTGHKETETSMAAIEAICRQMAGYPGRKSLVWVTSGVSMYAPPPSVGPTYVPPPAGPSAYAMIANSLKVINSTGIAIYPVDNRGLMSTMTMNPALAASAAIPGLDANLSNPRAGVDTHRNTPGLNQSPNTNIRVNDSHAAMNLIAERTGGRAFLNTNDIPHAVRAAIDDGDVSYNLSYSPDHNEWNGSFRKIHVEVNRSGVEVRNRGGYYANETDDTPEQRTDSLRRAAESPLLGTELGLRTLTGDALPASVTKRPEIRMVVDARDVSFHPGENGKLDASLDVMLLFRDDQGKIIGRQSRGLQISLTPTQRASVETAGMAFNSGLEIPGNASTARVVVRDTSNGAFGSVDVMLDR